FHAAVPDSGAGSRALMAAPGPRGRASFHRDAVAAVRHDGLLRAQSSDLHRGSAASPADPVSRHSVSLAPDSPGRDAPFAAAGAGCGAEDSPYRQTPGWWPAGATGIGPASVRAGRW